LNPLIWTGLAAIFALVIGWLLWGRPLSAVRAETALWRASSDDYKLRVAEAAVEVQGLQSRNHALATAESQREALAVRLGAMDAQQTERDRQFEERRTELDQQFAALAARALDTAQIEFLKRAEARFVEQKIASEAGLAKNQVELKAMLAPVAETLQRYEGELKAIEAARTEAYGGIKEQLAAVTAGQARVSDEASKLVSALRSSSKTSGSWGEQQLRNVLEMAGLRDGIDFTLQTSISSGESTKRPDAIINLPGGRQLIIDSKCSLNDYLNAGEADSDDARLAAYKRHAAAVRVHARGLSDRAYWREFGASADFVVMFLPGENFLSAALEHDLPLLGWAFDQRILLAGPINLLAIAKTVALVWRQETLAEKAREIGVLGAQLHASIAVMADHLAGVGKNLNQAVNGYNAFVGSLEGNVLPKARRFTELGVEEGKKAIPQIGQIESAVRTASAPELLALPKAEAAE
jgi:DNA recombination protein RmuC